MTKFWDAYHTPSTLDEAVELLARYDGRARIIAGGTDLLLDLQNESSTAERPHYQAMVDVTRIHGANQIREEDGWIVVGCAVTHAQIAAHPSLLTRAAALVEASGVVAGAQVRNVGTVIGNVAHALPAADSAVALAVLGAQARVVGARRAAPDWLPITSLYKGPGESAVDPTCELIAAIRFRPTGAGEASAFARVMRPQGIALPILGMAARVQAHRQKAHTAIEEVAISAGPVAPVLFRASKTEEFLRGQTWGDGVASQAGRVLVDEARPRTSAHRATKDYRYELLPTMLHDVLTRAIARAIRP